MKIEVDIGDIEPFDLMLGLLERYDSGTLAQALMAAVYRNRTGEEGCQYELLRSWIDDFARPGRVASRRIDTADRGEEDGS